MCYPIRRNGLRLFSRFVVCTRCIFTGGGRIVKLDCGSDTFENGFQQYLTGEIMGMFPDAYLANNIVSPLYAGEPMFTFAFDTNSKSFCYGMKIVMLMIMFV